MRTTGKKILSFALAAVLALGSITIAPLTAQADEPPATSGSCGDNLTWEYDGEATTLTIRGTGEMANYNVAPNNNAPPWNVYLADITTVSIDEGVTSIGTNAFQNCTSLASITIPASVTYIGYRAFGECPDLTTVTFGEGSQLEEIDDVAFYNCTSLSEIEIPASVTTIRQAFTGCTALETVSFGDDSQLETIDWYAFAQCTSLTSITIPAGVRDIRYRAFLDCTSLASIHFLGEALPSKQGIDSDAFENALAEEGIIYYPNSVTGGTTYNAAALDDTFSISKFSNWTFTAVGGGDAPSAFSVTSSAGYGGKITKNGSTYTVTPTVTGYVIDGVYVDGVPQSLTEGDLEEYNYEFVDDGKSHSIFATFAYTVNFNSPANGSLSVLSANGNLTSGTIVRGGQNLEITAAPASGYVLQSLSINEVDVTDDYSNGYAYTVGTLGSMRTVGGGQTSIEGANITAVFAPSGGSMLSDNAGLVSVAGQTISAGSEAGIASEPKAAAITVANSVSSVSASNITAATGASVKLYSDSTFSTEESVNLSVGSDNHLYIKVTAEDGVTVLYYHVTVIRENAPATPTLTMTGVKTTLTVGSESDGQTVATASATGFSESPITYSISEGTLPSGLSLNSSTGEITVATATDLTATPAATVTVKAEAGSESATATVTITIVAASTPVLTATPTSLSFGSVRTGNTSSASLSIGGSNLTDNITYTITGDSSAFLLDTSDWNAASGGTLQVTFTPAQTKTYAASITFTSDGATPVAVALSGSGYTSGGGSSSDDDDSDSGSKPIITIAPAKQPDWPTIGSVSGKVTGTTAQRTFTITDSMVKSALEKAQAEAKAQNRTAHGIGARIALDTPAAAGLTVTLERAALNRLVSEKAKRLELTGTPIALTLDAKALAALQKQSVGDVTITVQPVTVKGVRNAYDIALTTIQDGKMVQITSLGTGTATLSIPFTPGKNEAAGRFYAVYVDANGKVSRIADSAYDANSGGVLLRTNHFSVYGVGYTGASAKFTDTAEHWAAESIDYVVGRGLLSGTSETTFAPDTAMTRGMLVTALGRLANVDTKAYTTNSFTDVKADSAFRPYIEWAYKKGIVQGIGNSQFAPDRAVTREEIAVIFANYAKATGYKLPVTRAATTYADASSIGSTYQSAVTAMQQAGVMMGGSGNKLNPKSSVTRAEVSAMLHRYVKLTIDPVTAQGWAQNKDGQFFYYKDGKMLTGTQTIDSLKYCFDTTGLLQTGWVQDGDNWRFYSGNRLLVGFWNIGFGDTRKRYYFDIYGNMAAGKWLQIDGKWYYFYPDGSLAISTKIDEYEVDENGVRKTR